MKNKNIINKYLGITAVPRKFMKGSMLSGPNGVPMTLTRSEKAVSLVLDNFYNKDRVLLGWTKKAAAKYRWSPKTGYTDNSPLKGNIVTTQSVNIEDCVVIYG